MVLLPCPRLQLDRPVSATALEQHSVSDSMQEGFSEASDDQNLDDHAIEVIFGQSNVTIDASTTAPSVSGVLTDTESGKKGRISLSRLSDKLLTKFARGSRLVKKPLTISDAQIEIEARTEPGCSDTALSASPNILASIAASDCGYDSDARHILTPQIIAQPGFGSGLGRPEAILPTMEDRRESSQALLQMGYDGAVPDSFGLGMSYTAAVSSEDERTPTYSAQIPLSSDEANRLEACRHECGIPRYSLLEADDNHDSETQYINLTPTRKSKSARESDDCASLRAVKSPVNPSWPLEDSGLTAAGNIETLPYHKREPPGDLRFEGALRLSAYSDHEPQDIVPQSSYQKDLSVKGMQETLKCRASPEEKDLPLRLPEESMDRCTVKPSSLLRENQPPRNPRKTTELCVSRIRTLRSTAQKEQGSFLTGRRSSLNLVQSRFIENLEDVFVDNPCDINQNKSISDQTNDEIKKTSQAWLTGGKRLGYNYDFVPNSKPSPLQAHEKSIDQFDLATSPSAGEASSDAEKNLPKEETNQGNAEIKLHKSAWKDSKRQSRKSSGLLSHLNVLVKSRRHQLSSSESALTNMMLSEARRSNLHMPDTFGGDEDENAPHESKTRQFFRKWKRRSISDTTGCHSSTRRSPNNQNIALQEQIVEESPPYNTTTSFSERLQVENKAIPTNSHASCRAPPNGLALQGPNSAEGWSKIYENCVERPAVDDELGSTSSGGSNRAQYARTVYETLEQATSSDGTDLRGSTIRFNEAQLAAETVARENLLKMVNDTWGR
ncbi:uncharacterized protein CIMG_04061 [Coccidioides immitis RS]|uniref:Uncharacterized protein n=3 Tax=Coccidioides immitis TaxID=5501 RepID=A0A0E1RWX9_COCIM|nr:uncharacterized protein CIMG_04061 [Coccidioides immitis RS]EAS33037.2 hypothetical protein CIMG_04061 [Coccidioides immitis RS]KMP08319.1 hypothetical protein CIRG_08000 [Coccidioides immitis RMSCC 2394]KMU88646.1 hypothetical protein CIHG_06585 [Coccidioides immitis H538.4]TPX19970.1 hypothetical protein DIZ76_017765 [Coccidioides immitis]